MDRGGTEKLTYNLTEMSATGKSERKVNSKRKTCAYTGFNCTRPRVESFQFCIRHLLEDKVSSTKLCNYVYPTERRCHRPAIRPGKELMQYTISNGAFKYCLDHARKANLIRARFRRRQPERTREYLLYSLSHYSLGRNDSEQASHDEIVDVESTEAATPSINPFVDINAHSVRNETNARILEYASESDTDDDVATLENTQDMEDLDSYPDSIPIIYRTGDYLANSQVFTAEEASLLMVEKLTLLKNLYKQQFNSLAHTLKEQQNKYKALKASEAETFLPLSAQLEQFPSPVEQSLYKRLKAYNKFHNNKCKNGLFRTKLQMKKDQLTGKVPIKTEPVKRCIYSDDSGSKCGCITLPLSKYCRRHILKDPRQVLFKACVHNTDGVPCREPLVPLSVIETNECKYHVSATSLIHSQANSETIKTETVTSADVLNV